VGREVGVEVVGRVTRNSLIFGAGLPVLDGTISDPLTKKKTFFRRRGGPVAHLGRHALPKPS
jgi:hypothetical protein